MKNHTPLVALALTLCLSACDDPPTTTDSKQAAIQAQALAEADKQVGMPALPNWQEKRMMKDLYELRDKAIATHAYIVNELQGCLVYLGPAQGYGLPYATEYTAPTKYDRAVAPNGTPGSWTYQQMPQAEPNGLFMPVAAEGTWVMLLDPSGSGKTMPVYIEPRVVVAPFRLEAQECHGSSETTTSGHLQAKVAPSH